MAESSAELRIRTARVHFRAAQDARPSDALPDGVPIGRSGAKRLNAAAVVASVLLAPPMPNFVITCNGRTATCHCNSASALSCRALRYRSQSSFGRAVMILWFRIDHVRHGRGPVRSRACLL